MSDNITKPKLPPKILLVAKSGSGKTYSLRNLNPDTTALINVEYKELPFDDNFKLHVLCNTWQSAFNAIKQAASSPVVETIVIDSLSAYLDYLMTDARANKKGFDIFNYYNEQIGIFMSLIKQIQKPIILTAHYEWLQDEGGMKERRVKVKGKEWEAVLEKEFTIVLYGEVQTDIISKKRTYKFILNSDGTSSAKCPPKYFGEETNEIPNDCKLLLDTILSKNKIVNN